MSKIKASTCFLGRLELPVKANPYALFQGIIITVLAFLRKRTSFKKDVWGGRPGLVVPIDFLGIDNDRLAIMCVFGAATGSIFNLITVRDVGQNVWGTAFLSIGTALEVAFLYYPYFGCLASYHRIIGALMGLPYAVVYFSISMTADLQKCNDITTWNEYVEKILPKIPTMLCQLFIMGKFILVLYKEIKEYGIFGMQLFSHDDEHVHEHVKLIRPWLSDHVKDLIKSKPARQYSGIEFYLRKIYNPEKNFKFSTQTVSVVMICCILLYNISIELVFTSSYLLDQVRKATDKGLADNVADPLRGVLGSMIAATILAAIFCMVSLVRFMENHKNCMLRMFKGDKSFIPKKISASQFMIGKGLRYSSYQIGYFLWGYILLFLLFLVICVVLYAFISYKIVQDYVVKFIKGGG
ncbi:Hypothetical predicted protein [Paramuricea clavata]|uniref:Uncharacterized protein n=1 Tax=Paramuricea clavata TaxID=317549 RepID=A0A6S7FSF1_PARCT|nr:Hypothetical predicted protein [Paramuricea clavata]